MGIHNVGDCLRLPREGFARRFGAERLLDLDRALGDCRTRVTQWRAPERFCADYEMTEEQSDRELLLKSVVSCCCRMSSFCWHVNWVRSDVAFSFFHLKSAATKFAWARHSLIVSATLVRSFDDSL